MEETASGNTQTQNRESTMINLPCISLWQFYASAIHLNVKKIETRPRPWKHRGDIAIHAAKRPMLPAEKEVLAGLKAQFGELEIIPDFPPLGVVLCVAELYDCKPTEDINDLCEMELSLGNFTSGRFGWMLRNVRPLKEALRWPGKQGIFRVNIPKQLLP